MGKYGFKILTILIVAPIAVYMAISIAKVPFNTGPKQLLAPNDVRGMALLHNHELYTLNFEQQKKVIHSINLANNIENEPEIGNDSFDYNRLNIYLFEKPTLKMIPIRLDNGLLVFKLKNITMKEQTAELNNLLTQVNYVKATDYHQYYPDRKSGNLF